MPLDPKTAPPAPPSVAHLRDMNRVTENRNYGFSMGIGVECEYGQVPAYRTDGTNVSGGVPSSGLCPNYMLIEHAVTYGGIPTPLIAG